MELGIFKFMPMQTFLAPFAGEDPMDFYINIDNPPPPPTGADWPRISTAILRGTTYVIEGETQGFRATLYFRPDQPREGRYEIRWGRPPTERGTIVKVHKVPIEDIATTRHFEPLRRFPLRFAVRTAGNNRELMWLVGMEKVIPQGEPEPSDMENGIS